MNVASDSYPAAGKSVKKPAPLLGAVFGCSRRLYNEAMTTLTIDLREDQVQKLEQLAERYQVAPEKLVQISIDELLSRPQDDFEEVLTYLLQKNADLYRQLA